jgi:hypothetical protein
MLQIITLCNETLQAIDKKTFLGFVLFSLAVPSSLQDSDGDGQGLLGDRSIALVCTDTQLTGISALLITKRYREGMVALQVGLGLQ